MKIKPLLHATRLLLSWLCIILLGLELGLRAFGFSFYWAFARYPDAYRGFAPLPNTDARQELEGSARIRINRYGFRDRDWTEKPANAHRIAVLGDSFTAAVQLPLEHTWWRLLEAQLRDCGYRGGSVELHEDFQRTSILLVGQHLQLQQRLTGKPLTGGQEHLGHAYIAS